MTPARAAALSRMSALDAEVSRCLAMLARPGLPPAVRASFEAQIAAARRLRALAGVDA